MFCGTDVEKTRLIMKDFKYLNGFCSLAQQGCTGVGAKAYGMQSIESRAYASSRSTTYKNQAKQAGMTLIELSVVLLILVALAGITIPYLGGTSRKALCDATDITMSKVKRVIMDRYFLDTLGAFPATRGGTDFSLHYLFNAGGWAVFDPDTQIGWRGPYLSSGLTLSASDVASLDASFNDSGGGTPRVETNFTLGDSVVLDGWGRPIILQNSPSGFRLVSAGFGTGVGLANAAIDSTIAGNRAGDDRILYLNASTPAVDINLSCD